MARSTDIGSLNVRLVAITSQFNKGLGDARKTLATFSRTMNMDVTAAVGRVSGVLAGGLIRAITSIPSIVMRAVRALLSLAKTLAVTLLGAVTAVSAALTVLTVKSFRAVDQMAKDARRVGIAVETYSVLALAAREAGVQVEALTSLFPILSKNIGIASMGTGKAAAALKQLGIPIADILFLAPDKQFELISKAMQGVTLQADRMRIATALFGGSAAEILPLLSVNMEEAQRWARLLNVEVSRFDAAQIENANDKVGRLRLAFEGVGNYLSSKLAPIVAGLGDKMLKFIADQGGVAAIVDNIMTLVVARGVKMLNRLGEAMTSVRNFASGLNLDVSSPGDAIQTSLVGIGKVTQAALYLGQTFKAVWLSFKTLALTTLAGVTLLIATSVRGWIDIFNLLPGVDIDTDPIKAFASSLVYEAEAAAKEANKAWGFLFGQSLLRSTENGKQSLEQFGSFAKQTVDSVSGKFAEGWMKIEETISDPKLDQLIADLMNRISSHAQPAATAFNDLATSASRYFDIIRSEGPSERISKLTEQLKESKDKLSSYADEMERIWARTADSIADSLASTIVRGENLFESLRETALRVIEEILSAMIRMAVIQPILKAFGFGGGGGGGGLFGSIAAGASAASGATVNTAGLSAMSGSFNKQDSGGLTFVFNGPVAGEKVFEDIVVRALRRKDATNYIEGVSETRVKTVLRREQTPLAGY